LFLKQREKNKEVLDVTQGPMIKKLFLFALPIIFTDMVQYSFNAIDKAVVGRYVGSYALGGVSVTSTLITLIVSLFSGLSSGTMVALSQSLGINDHKSALQISHTAICAAVLGGLLLGGLGILFSTPLLLLMDTPTEILPYSVKYIKIYFAGAPFLLLLNYGKAILQSTGDTIKPTIFIILGGITKICLNFIFITKFNMDSDGVALSTVLSNLLSSSLILITLCRMNNCCKITFRNLRITLSKLKRILSLGIPAGIQSSVYGLAGSVLQSSINTFGSAAVAGNGASQSIEVYAEAFSNGLGIATMTFAAQNFSAKNYTRVKSIIIKACIFSAMLTLAFTCITIPIRSILIGLFIDDNPTALAIGCERYISIISLQFLSTIMSVLLISLRGIGRSTGAMFAALIGSCGTRILWIFTVFKKFPTLKTVYAVYPVSWVITTLLCLFVFYYTYKKLDIDKNVI